MDLVESEETVKNYLKQFIEESDIQIGILFRKGLASKDSLLKSYKLDNLAQKLKNERKDLRKGMTATSSIAQLTNIEEQIGCKGAGIDFENTVNIPALIARLELYVDEFKWKESSDKTKSILYAFIGKIEELMQKNVLKLLNEQRC